jgi:hypothetical protein
MERDKVRVVFWVIWRTMAADLSPEAESRSHRVACEIASGDSCARQPEERRAATRVLAPTAISSPRTKNGCTYA